MGPFQVCERVYQIGGPGITAPEDCRIYLIDGGGELAVVDTGAGESVDDLLFNIEQLYFDPSKVKYIIVTHGHIDHTGGLARLKEKFVGAAVAAHELELPAIEGGNARLTAAALYGVDYEPVKVDLVLKGDGEVLELGDLKIVCLFTPGHTPGGISPYVDIGDKRVLFGQDIHGPFNEAWGSDMTAWERSMRRLLALGADILCEGHFGIYQPKEKARQYIKGYLRHYSDSE